MSLSQSIQLSPCPHPNFVQCVLTFRIIVLTWNRPSSLKRLLTSLEDSDYYFHDNNQNWRIELEIHRDGGGGDEGRRTMEVAEQFKFTHGNKRVVEADQNQGALESWRNAWSWRADELFVILEDDNEVSHHWYRWLTNMWLSYGEKDDIAAICLEKPTFTLHHGIMDVSSLVSTSVFMYGMPCTTGPSPHPVHWTNYIREHGHQMDFCPAWLKCEPKMIEPSWLDFSDRNNHLFLYLSHEKTMASDHREKGVHSTVEGGRDHESVKDWESKWNKNHNTVAMDMITLQLEQLDMMIHKALWIKKKYSLVTVLVLHTCEDVQKLSSQADQLSDHTLYSVPYSCPSLSHPSIIPSSYNQTGHHQSPPTFSQYQDTLHIVTTILLKLVSYKIPVTTLPSPWSFLPSPSLATSSPVSAGRCRESRQQSPSLDWIFLDAKLEVYNMLVYLQKLLETKKFTNLSKTLSSFKLWSWGSINC